MKIGIISDTHGIFREEWHRHLDGCDYLIHAGDFCTQKNYDCFRNFGICLRLSGRRPDPCLPAGRGNRFACDARKVRKPA